MSNRNGIILVIADLAGGGSQQVLSKLANLWEQESRRIAVVTFALPETDFFGLAPGIERFSLGSTGISNSLLAGIYNNVRRVVLLRRVLKAYRGETAIGFVTQTNLLLIAASHGLGYRVVISERNDPARQSFGPLWDFLRRRFYRLADLVTANSHGALETLRGYVPAHRLAFVPNLLREAPSGPQATTVERETLFLNVGRLHHQKAQDILIRAFAKMSSRLPDWRLAILGEGERRADLERLASELGVADRLEMPGAVDDPFAWYRRAGVFVLPSRVEGTPNALMEAMACGTPVIVSDASHGPLELVEHGVSGLVLPVEDADGLAAAMVRLAQKPGLARRYSAEAIKRVASHAPRAALKVWDEVLDASQ